MNDSHQPLSNTTRLCIQQNSYKYEYQYTPKNFEFNHANNQHAERYINPIQTETLRENYMSSTQPSPVYRHVEPSWRSHESSPSPLSGMDLQSPFYSNFSPRFHKSSTFDEVFQQTPTPTRSASLPDTSVHKAPRVPPSPTTRPCSAPINAQPQQYTEYSFVSHNSKGKRGRRKKSVTIFSTQNPFGGTFVDDATQDSTPTRQFTNMPNTMFTTYTPNSAQQGVTKPKTKPKSNLKVRTSAVFSTPAVITSVGTTTDEIIYKMPSPSTSSPSSASDDSVKNSIPSIDGSRALDASPIGSPSGMTDIERSLNHSKLRRVSIKNLLC